MPPDGLLETLLRYYYTAKYLRGKQIATRIYKKLSLSCFFPTKEFKVSDLPVEDIQFSIRPDHEQILARLERESALNQAKEVLEGRFYFIGEVVNYKEDVKWNPPSRPRLWKFNLHYFGYLIDLGYAYLETGEDNFLQRAEELVGDWVNKHQKVTGDPWHPYVISRRAVNWIYFYALVEERLSEEIKSLLVPSLQFQLEYLQENLEYDLLANHLLSDARALYIGGIFLGDEEMAKKGKSVLTEQVEEQILPDGGHFERSPTYHCKVLMDLLDCLSWTPSSDEAFGKKLRNVSESMAGFLKEILLTDGEIPLFNDSTLSGGPSPALLFDYARELGVESGADASEWIKSLEQSGYYIIRSDEDFMIIDGGKIGPDYQPGHGHCDLFSYEYMLNGDELIVDSGVYDYEDGEMREYCRSTRAHNTVMIDGEEQSEIWKSFRVGRKAEPKEVSLKEEGNKTIFQGWYSHPLISGAKHKRWIIKISSKKWIVLDLVHGNDEEFHRASSFIHLHPDVESIHKEDNGFWVKLPEGQSVFITQSNSDVSVREGWYCPEFGKRKKNHLLELTAEGSSPLFFGYLISGEESSNFRAGIENMKHNLISNIKIGDVSYQLNDSGDRSTLTET